MINFNFTLSEMEASSFADMLNAAVVEAQHKALFTDTDAERNWWHGHAAYLKGIYDKIIGNIK
jgi:hypothetical protein